MSLRIVKPNTRIDFLGRSRRRIAVALSALLIVASIGSLATRSLEFGIDFTGGVLLEVGYPAPANLDRIRGIMTDAGFAEVQVQSFGSDSVVLLRLPPQPDADSNQIRADM